MKHQLTHRTLTLLLAILLSFIGMNRTFAQSTVGTDFWTSFMPNAGSDAVDLTLIVTGPRACSGTVTNPNTNWSIDFTVTPGTITNVSIPRIQGYHYENTEHPINIGLHITATDSISLYGSNFLTASFDVTSILPTPSLGDEYVVQAFPYSTTSRAAEMSIIATEDNTVVDINLTCNSIGGHVPNTPFSVTLNAGQCYQILTHVNNEMSGTHVKAHDQKKIAVLAGACSANVPTDAYTYADHLVEQMMPITTWGNHFVITQSCLRDNDVIRVTALNDDCQIRKNGNLITTINARETYQFEITSAETSCYLETSEPAAVFLYLTSEAYGGNFGDPSMVIINPIEQQIDAVTFGTFNSNYHFVNIVTNTDKVGGMTLDGSSIASQFSPVAGNALYSFARIEIQYGSHTIINTNGAFVAHVYGLGTRMSYAYSVGSMVVNLSSQMLINNTPSSQLPDGYNTCQEETVNFDLWLNYTMSTADWDFGDGGTASGCPVSHTFDTPGHYTVTCDVYQNEQGQNVLVATLTSVIHVWPTYQNIENINACDSYTWQGQTYSQSGQYTYNGMTSHQCDSTLILNLTINNATTTDLFVETCDDYYWFGQTYSQSGTYEHLLYSSKGCDSLLILHLNINETFSMEQTVEACDLYHWRGHDYTQSGTYVETVESPLGCDSIFMLNLTINNSQTTHLNETTCDSFEWYGNTYSQSGTYEHHLQTTAGCDSLVVLNLSIEGVVNVDTTANVCQPFTWYGQTYYESGEYEHLLYSSMGCDSLVTLKLIVNHAPELTMHGATQVFAATNLFSGMYYYYVTDSLTIEPNTLEWVCSNPDWIVTPIGNGYRCCLVVTTLGESTLKAIAHTDTGCDASFSLEINSTYFDVDDHQTIAVKLFPNPARNKVTVQSTDITRIRLINPLGQMVLDKDYEATDSAMFDISHLPSGVYIVRVSTKVGETFRRLEIAR